MSENPIQAVSNVIELKPDKKYLLVFKGEGITYEQLQEFMRRLATEMRLQCVGVLLKKDAELTVIEAPEL